jgi:hypothetical protein
MSLLQYYERYMGFLHMQHLLLLQLYKSIGEAYVASFSGINVDTSSENIEVYHKGELLGENTEEKTPYLLVMSVGGIQWILFSVI